MVRMPSHERSLFGAKSSQNSVQARLDRAGLDCARPFPDKGMEVTAAIVSPIRLQSAEPLTTKPADQAQSVSAAVRSRKRAAESRIAFRASPN